MYKSGVHCVIRHMWSAHMRRTVVCQMIRDDNDCRWWARYWNIMLEKVFNDTIERQKMQWAQHVQYQIMIGGTYVKIHVVKTCKVIHVGTNYFIFFVSMLTFLFSSPLRNACKYFTCGLWPWTSDLEHKKCN